MKSASVLLIALVLSLTAVQQIRSADLGPTRTITFTVKPESGRDGYEVSVTLTYRFHICLGDEIRLDGYRSQQAPVAYWYKGKRYTESEAGPFNKGKDFTYNNCDIRDRKSVV